MEYQYDESLLPPQITSVLAILDQAGFFEDGLLVGSWAILFYQEVLGTKYVLRTGDIDFAVIPETLKHARKATDLEAKLVAEGLEPIIDRSSGLQKFLMDLYEVEFLVHRRGGRDDIKLIKKYNINAQQLPFLDILFIEPLTIQLSTCTIRIPRPESLFFHKMIIAQRRKEATKREKDLEQCEILAPHLDIDALTSMAHGYKMGKPTIKQVKISCEAFGFSPDILIP